MIGHFPDGEFFYPLDKLHYPRCGISQCLLGENVRYDGGSKYHQLICRFLAPSIELVTVCPEMAAGLGVPRPPVRLVENDGIRAIGVEDSSLDVTESIIQTSNQFLDQEQENRSNPFYGFILKARSPSCGVGSAPLLNTGKPSSIGKTNGLFAAVLSARFPAIHTIDEESLDTESACMAFWKKIRISQELDFAKATNQEAAVLEHYGYPHSDTDQARLIN